MAGEWKVGDRLENRWEIHKIMRGGMGVVYIVHDHEWNEVLAAKTFQDAVFARNPAIAPMFKREALAWVQLDAHPNIAQALFVQEIEGKPVLFLEYVSGGDLSAWIGPRLTEDSRRALHFAIAFCDGMIHARSKGIEAHRDIKPQNCLVTENETLKITDFGLAKVFDDPGGGKEETGVLGRLFGKCAASPGTPSFSRTGAAAGTCTHMAPEQFVDSKHVGAHADIYSFGVMLYQMFSGHLPFSGQTWDDFEQLHRYQPAPPLQAGPPAVRGVVERCLAKQPAARWRDFIEVREPLAAAYEHLTGRAAPRPIGGVELNASQWLNKGVSLAALGLRDRALSCYDRALQINPHFAEAWSNKGNVIRDSGRLEEALACYAQAVASDPELDLAWHNKGATHDMLAQAPEALACLEKAIALNPHNVMAWSSKGVALDHLGRNEESLACFDKAMRLHPRFAAALANKGNQLRKLGRLEEALACQVRALEINADLLEVWYNQANVLSDLKRDDEALASYDKALALDQGFAPAWSGKGNVFIARQRPADALACYERALKINPGRADDWYNKAVSLQKLGRLDEAVDAYDQSLKLNSRDVDAWMKMGDALEALGRGQESYASYVAAVTADPNSALAWHNRGVKAKQLKKLEEALACHDRAVGLDPRMEEAWLGKANLLADLSRFDESLAAYDHLLSLNPRSASAWFSKGATLGNAERFREALECFERAQNLGHPKAANAAAMCREALAKDAGLARPEAAEGNMDPGAWHDKGAELAEQGRPAEALTCFERALAISPNSAATWYGKAVALGKLGREEEALAGFERAHTISPDFALAWYSKGVTLVSLFKRFGEALACFEKARQLGHAGAAQAIDVCNAELRKEAASGSGASPDAAAWHGKGAELDAQGKPAEALDCFDRALAIAPGSAETWFGRAVVLGKLGRLEEELASYDKVLAISPRFAGAWFNKGRTLGGRFNRFREALECFERAQQFGHSSAAQGIAICQKALADVAARAQAAGGANTHAGG
ncbi:MAG TPA: tetratricopeptide repeat protein [Bryobacteraceae bacterium]|nr:tetratricopeptide repeat protein [Bryobacteraceae bacterium]